MMLESQNTHSSFWAQLDPRSKMIFTVLFITNVIILDITDFIEIALIISILFTMILISGSRVNFYFLKILKLYPMIFLTTFLAPFSAFVINDQTLLNIGTISVYESGLIRFLNLNLKAIFILTSTLVLTTSTDYRSLIKCFENMKFPYWLLSILTILNRLIFLISLEMNRMQLAYKSRFIQLSFYYRIKYYAQLIAVYFVRIIDRNDRTFQAMISRGFSGRIYILSEQKWNMQDSFVVATGFCLTIIMMIWN
jgi:cobalt/nickel transport system permease protein